MIGSRALHVRMGSAAIAVLAATGLLVYQPVTPSAGADDDLRITDSAVTLRWVDGITGADNSTVVEERDTLEAWEGLFDDLEVTVGQTEGLRAQGLYITWSGMKPNSGRNALNSLQIMQCWAEDDSGPSPETCVWVNDASGFGVGRGSDPSDPRSDELPEPQYFFPYRSATGDEYGSGELPFDRWTTTQVSGAVSDGGGNGEVLFNVQDGIDAPHLGCGVGGDSGESGDCWLVIVPRGDLDYTGTPITSSPAKDRLRHTLSPSHWANRMQVRLDFARVDEFCPAGREQRLTVGSELVSEVMYSWQPVLCQGDDGTVYGYSPAADAEGRQQLLANAVGSAGMAFTSAPVEAGEADPPVVHAPVALSGAVVAFNVTEQDGSIVRDLKLTPRLVAKLLTQSYRDDLPGLGNIHNDLGDQTIPWWDSPEDWPPLNLLADPEYLELNDHDTHSPQNSKRYGGVKLRVPAGSYDALRELWRWVQADPEAAAWLDGEPDDWGMVVNPYFEDLDLEAPPAIDTVPREVNRCHRWREEMPEPGVCSTDLLPYTDGFEDGARQAALADTEARTGWNVNATNPIDGSSGWFTRTSRQDREARFVMAVTDTASAERFGLPAAALQNASGEFVAPTDSGLAAGLEAMVPSDVDGVLETDPDATDPEAYPLTMLTYAAVRESEEPEALADYSAFLEYAAGPGQERGVANGQLPLGYVPLNDELRSQTLAVAEDLMTSDEPEDGDDPPAFGRQGPGDGGSGDEDGDGGGHGGDGRVGGDGNGGNGAPPDGDRTGGDVPENAGPAPDPAALGPEADEGGASTDDGAPPEPGSGAEDGAGPGDPAPNDAAPPGGDDGTTSPVAQATPGEPIGPMQYALLTVLIIGLVGALAGPALLKLGPRAS